MGEGMSRALRQRSVQVQQDGEVGAGTVFLQSEELGGM